MKNTENVARVTRWQRPGLVKKMDSWRDPEQNELRLIAHKTGKKPVKEKFGNWNLPDQPEGYIKCKRHDFF